MKTVLIEPAGGQKHGYNLGLGYLASSLKAAGQKANVFDLNVSPLSDAELLKKIDEIRPEIIGFSIKSAVFFEASRLAELFKKNFPEIKIAAGGAHISICGQELLAGKREQSRGEFAKYPDIRRFGGCHPFSAEKGNFSGDSSHFIDFAFSGECEISFTKFCKEVERSGFTGDLPRFYSCENPPRLDTLPFPDFSDFYCLDQKLYPYPLVTSRGCPFNCLFCCVSKTIGKKWRARSPENVLEEIALAKRAGVPSIDINDDNFTLDIDRAKRICELIIKRRIKIPWQCHNGIRAKGIDPELARLMKKAGCWSVALGIETGNPETFNTLGKGELLEDITKAVKILKNAKIRVGGYFIIGLPGETPGHIKRSIEFKNSLGLDFFTFGILVPYSGTPVYEWIKENGRFLEDYRKAKHFGLNIKPVFESGFLKAQEILDVYALANIGDKKKICDKIDELCAKKSIRLKKALVVRTLLSDNLAQILKDKHKDIEITLLSEESIETEFPYEKVVPVRVKRVFELLRTILNIRKGKYDLIIFISPERKGMFLLKLKLLCLLTGAKIRLNLNAERETICL